MSSDRSIGTDDTLLPAETPALGGGAAELAPGTMVDRYEVVERIGAGGMGVVYRARDPKLGRELAIKLLRLTAPGTSSCGVLCSLLLREAQTMARVTHPNLVTIYDVGEHGGCVYVAMELVEGETLRQWAAAPERGWRERLDALLEAGRGLVEAHAIGIVHRDFKPDNVLVSRRGRVQVTDFGLARAPAELDAAAASIGCATCGPVEPPAELIGPDAVVGTPAYMSPEQHQGQPADQRSDQFAFSVTAWEVLYDAHPFPGRTLAEIRSAVLGEQVLPPPRRSKVPRRVADVLRRGLRVNASARFPSMSDLLERLAAAAR